MEENVGTDQRGELLAEIRRLARTMLDRLGQGAGDGSLDQSQMRMFGSLALRTLRLWHEVLERGERKQEAASVAELAEKLTDSQGRGVQA